MAGHQSWRRLQHEFDSGRRRPDFVARPAAVQQRLGQHHDDPVGTDARQAGQCRHQQLGLVQEQHGAAHRIGVWLERDRGVPAHERREPGLHRCRGRHGGVAQPQQAQVERAAGQDLQMRRQGLGDFAGGPEITGQHKIEVVQPRRRSHPATLLRIAMV